MAYKTKLSKREYQKTWISQRRAAWIEEHGPCVRCGSRENLQVDHVDPKKKTIKISQVWSRRKEVRDAELSKCQVLCECCHKLKSLSDGSREGCVLRGDRNPNTKLSESDVLSIREEIKTESIRSVARKYSVDHTTILSLRDGLTWKHV